MQDNSMSLRQFFNVPVEYKPDDAESGDQPIRITVEITPLEFQCAANNLAMVKAILAKPKGAATINSTGTCNITPLAYAIKNCKKVNDDAYQIVRELLEQKADITHPSVKEALKDKM